MSDTSTLELVAQTLAYTGVGLVILVLGFYVLDILTPGKLGELVASGNKNAATITAATLGSLGLVLWFAIYFTGTGWDGLDEVAIFGVVAVLAQAVGFLVLDVITPGKLGQHVTHAEYHPATAVSAAVQFAVALIICASLT